MRFGHVGHIFSYFFQRNASVGQITPKLQLQWREWLEAACPDLAATCETFLRKFTKSFFINKKVLCLCINLHGNRKQFKLIQTCWKFIGWQFSIDFKSNFNFFWRISFISQPNIKIHWTMVTHTIKYVHVNMHMLST